MWSASYHVTEETSRFILSTGLVTSSSLSRRTRKSKAGDNYPPREQIFVDEHLANSNGAQAVIRAGYAQRSAAVTASKLLIKLNIRAALDKGYADRRLRSQVTGDAVTLQLARIAFSNLAVMFDERGRLKHLHDLPLDAQVVIGSIEVVTNAPSRKESHQR
jgi:hypothetical protein